MAKNSKSKINEVFSKEQIKVIFEKYSDSKIVDEKSSKKDDEKPSLGIYEYMRNLPPLLKMTHRLKIQ